MLNIPRTLRCLSCCVALTLFFWWPLYQGAGFIGGDLYPYFFPQKAYYADHLRQGEFPLWNDLTGFGYPIMGESQTGAAYPFHLLTYLLFDLNTAYNFEHLLHYGICFVGTWLFARRLQINEAGALFAALVFTYGWFPPRACLEWAVLTGCWLPVALYCAESFLQTRWWRYSIGLSIALGLQLLAGHFHLAFITLLVVTSYSLWRLWGAPVRISNGGAWRLGSGRTVPLATLLLAIVGGMGLAAIQLVPTWELKQRSTRVVSGGDYDPTYGHLPPLYATQLITPWLWYSPLAIQEESLFRDIAELAAPWHLFGPRHDLDQAIRQARLGALSTGTNKVEAHVYAGLLPFGLALIAVIRWLQSRRNGLSADQSECILDSMLGYWLVAGSLALIYATGWLLPLGLKLPGFSFFRGPGRYGIVTTLAIALISGRMLSRLSRAPMTRLARAAVVLAIFVCTSCDLWLVSRMVTYAFMMTRPAIAFREASDVRQRLLQEPEIPRLLAPGPNVGNLLGVSCVPWYLGIAPAEYEDPRFVMPERPKPRSEGEPVLWPAEFLEWLSQSGVTHVLSFDPLNRTENNVELLWTGVDPFLNRVWGRTEPIFLYRFSQQMSADDGPPFPGRSYLMQGSRRVVVEQRDRTTSGFRRIVVPAQDQEDTLVVTELSYPGWRVQRNGVPIEENGTEMFRTVSTPAEGGEFVWTYRPQSVTIGAIISLATFLLLAGLGHVKFWHPKLVERILSGAGTPGIR